MPDKPNALYFGDNLKVLREHIPDESVDLIYLDPPFNSSRNYNVLFRDEKGKDSEAQITAFEDTWHWNYAAEETYNDLTLNAPESVATMIGAMRQIVGTNQMMAYLVMMAARLVELHRVLKPTGSLYLHCDPAASHYLKIALDAIFGGENFRNEIIWRRTRAHNDQRLRKFGATHDVILYYSKSNEWVFNKVFIKRAQGELRTHDLYKHTDGKLYRKGDCRAPGGRGPRFVWNGHEQNWRFTQEQAKQLEAEGRIVYSKSGMPRVLRPVDLDKGSPIQDIWTDIDPPNSGSSEMLGYPTQKPFALLERILTASSNPGDVVLDPFCGCGTAVVAAQGLGRRWIGIDITYLAIALIRNRIKDMYPDADKSYNVIGLPEDVDSARQLALQSEHDGRYQFQFWALSLIGAKPLGADSSGRGGKRGADGGIDGVITFLEPDGKPARVIVQVKSGHVERATVEQLVGTVQREKAAIGVLITLEKPTKPMEVEAAEAKSYRSGFQYMNRPRDYPKIQILTIEQLLKGAEVKMPPLVSTFKRAQRAATQDDGGQLGLFEQGEEGR